MDVKSLGASIDIDCTSIAVGTTAVLLSAGVNARRSMIIFNNASAGGAVLYVGGNDVVVGGSGTANSGFPVPPQTSLALDVATNIGGAGQPAGAAGGAGVWGISTGAQIDVRVLEIA